METIEDMVRNRVGKMPELSFNKSDVERRLLFPAGNFTSPGLWLSLLCGIVITIVFFAVMIYIPSSQISVMFIERGVIPYVIVFFTAWSFSILCVKYRKILLQEKALRLRILPTDDSGFILTPASAERVLEKLYEAVDDPERFLLTRRILVALGNLRNMGDIGDVDKVLNTQADNDEAVVDSSYTVLRGFVWAIPVLGFIGTVLGLSIALGSFGNVLSHTEQMSELKSALQSVTGGLSTAFETTLEGLVSALCIQMWMTSTQRREERFLDACKEYCQKYIVGRLRLISSNERSK
jgi:biopolymer transport protein ExbB/TolQ